MHNHDDKTWELLVSLAIMVGFIWIAFVLTSGCSTMAPSPSTKVVEPSPVPIVLSALAADWDGKHPEWTPLLVQAIHENGTTLMAAKTPGVCANKLAFYVLMISTMSRFESNHNAAVTYTEKFRDLAGNLIISRGPLQVSKESCNGYGAGIKDEKTLADPLTNFRCAVRVLNKWIPRDNVLAGGAPKAWTGGARYWSVLRDPVKKKVILDRANEACK